jgi:hypothetical protein
MIVYDHDSAAILAEQLKNRSECELLRAYTKLHQNLTDRGLHPQLQKLDNKCSAALKQFMCTKNVNFQLVPPYDHRQNAAERAIGIWKDHFGLGLPASTPTFQCIYGAGWSTSAPNSKFDATVAYKSPTVCGGATQRRL